jgi:hypothetical protein
VAAMVTDAPSRTVRAGARSEADEDSSGTSRGRDTSGDAWSFTSGSRTNGSARSEPVVGSENAASTRALVIAGRSGLIPHATQPEGETKEPVNAASSVAFAASYVHASVAPCVGSAMHLSYVFTGVDVVHRPAAAALTPPPGSRTAAATTSSMATKPRPAWQRITHQCPRGAVVLDVLALACSRARLIWPCLCARKWGF